jgi:protein-tyrosine phosphatase
MLFFKNKKKQSADFSMIGVDMHSHLLPGIDDGSQDLATSIDLVKGMLKLGFKKLVTTPHIMWDIYKNTPSIVNEKLSLLQEALKEEGLEVEIKAAAEYFLDDHVAGLLKNNEPLLTVHDKWVLSEFSLAYPAHGLKDILFDMQMQGYQPVIAHPERYIYLQQTKDFYDDLKATGCLFQLNILSLGGFYGKAVQELAHYLIKKGYYDLVGTDLHQYRHLEALGNPELADPLKKLMDTGKIRNGEMG